jgi:hypothetical protein
MEHLMDNNRCWRILILIWFGFIFLGISFIEYKLEGRSLSVSMRHRVSLGHRPMLPKEEKRSPNPRENKTTNPLKEVVICEKRSRDFEYFPGIWRAFLGKPYRRNRGLRNQYQRYILSERKEITGGSGNPTEENKDQMENLSGVYAVILLKNSLKNWMGHGTITLEYIHYGSLEVQRLHFPIGERDVADDKQIFIFLDPERKNRKKFIAWKVKLHDLNADISFSRESFNWEMLKQKQDH